jgi:ribosomal 30S subunit maturation factor RimM
LDHFLDAPAAPVMVVRGEREHWIPAAPPHLVRVNLGQGEIVVDWPDEI